eukprot:TRINITY_DN59058_c0_g1_i1.p1 TRINITY_DN59058_c0_g1~~TRINITY_DN59058_c0_g1_i1.p1  ORF type:complete len:477 (+),score=36.92 TRINITY_DN59058_c0_g1_i1:43-1473(+)
MDNPHKTVSILLGFGRQNASQNEEKYLEAARARLEGLGFRLTISDPCTWGSNYDYSKFDTIALLASCNPVYDPRHLFDTIRRGEIGLVVFGAWNCSETLQHLGIISDGKIKHQSAHQVCKTMSHHFITEHMEPPNRKGTYDFGTKFVSCILNPACAEVLLEVDGDPALVVHRQYRIAVSHWTADPTQPEREAWDSIQCTRKTVLWTAGVDKLPETEPTLCDAQGGNLKKLAPSARDSDRRQQYRPTTKGYAGAPLGSAMPSTGTAAPFVKGASPTHQPAPVPLVVDTAPFVQLVEDYKKLLDNVALADVVFNVGEKQIYANKAILAIRSKHFSKWLIDDAPAAKAPSSPAAAVTSQPLDIKVADNVEYLAFKVVLEYLYTNAIPSDLTPTTLLNVLVLAQEYGIDALKTTCENTITESTDSANVIALLIAAHVNSQSEIKEMAMDFIKRHMDQVKQTGSIDQLEKHPLLMLELLKM